ncbi:hypothetical protein KC356_g158 [Hortaea werneckii]|nr:hypothetical protein KC356_g158 [Hortaea werneckii]
MHSLSDQALLHWLAQRRIESRHLIAMVVLLGVGAHRRRAAYLMRKDIDLHVRLHNAELDVEWCNLMCSDGGEQDNVPILLRSEDR